MAARKLLQECFGRPYTIAANFVGEIIEGPQIRPCNHSGLLELANQLKKLRPHPQVYGLSSQNQQHG